MDYIGFRDTLLQTNPLTRIPLLCGGWEGYVSPTILHGFLAVFNKKSPWFGLWHQHQRKTNPAIAIWHGDFRAMHLAERLGKFCIRMTQNWLGMAQTSCPNPACGCIWVNLRVPPAPLRKNTEEYAMMYTSYMVLQCSHGPYPKVPTFSFWSLRLPVLPRHLLTCAASFG